MSKKQLTGIKFVNEPPKKLISIKFTECDFKEYSLGRSIIKDCIFVNCDFIEAGFPKATIINCEFVDCAFEYSGFTKAVITGCNFTNCFMQYVNLVSAKIQDSSFKDCDFWHSNMCYSTAQRSIFTNCVLKALFKDLDWVDNIIDDRTIIESCGGTHCEMDLDVEEYFRSSGQIA